MTILDENTVTGLKISSSPLHGDIHKHDDVSNRLEREADQNQDDAQKHQGEAQAVEGLLTILMSASVCLSIRDRRLA